ncbi:MAG TPA: corrinoid protein [Anaerolineae bacterium]|nr:corrinoid protein [Anaerolineae bacterium]
MDERLQKIYDSVLNGEMDEVSGHVQAALDASLDPGVILNEGMIRAMQEVGRLFEEGEYFVPEMLISARAMQDGLALLKPHLVQADVQSAGKVVIGTVKGDLHDIGKNLVAMMLEGASFEIIDLGIDVSPEKFVEAVKVHHPKIVGLSALLTTTMPSMRTIIEALTAANVRDQVKVIIGGAPVTEAYARDIGADGFAPDASRAVKLAKSLLG